MSTYEQVWTRSFLSGDTSMSGKQFFLAKRHTVAGQCVLEDSATVIPIGIIQNNPLAAGRAVEIMALGQSTAEVEATSDIAIGSKLGPNTDGRLIIKTANNDLVCAIAEAVATTATGDRIPVTIFPCSWYGA